MKNTNNRVLYLDYLRIISILAVIILHVAGQKWYVTDFHTHQWKVFHIIDSAVRWSVPLFIMISGALFLDNNKPLSIKKLYSKNILRIVIATIVWSTIYTIVRGIKGLTVVEVLSKIIMGNFHMWYLFMIIGLYMATPILRKITESKKTTEYFLIIGAVMTFIIPRTTAFLKIFEIPEMTLLVNSINEAVSDMYFHLTLGYVFYFVLGYYLATYEISSMVRKVIYIYGPISYVATVLLTTWHSELLGKASSHFYSYTSINVLLMTVAVFVFAKHVLSRIQLSGKVLKIVLHLSKCSFGIYLVHILILNQLDLRLKFNALSYGPIMSVVLLTIVVFAISYIIVAILHKIPIIKKYIV